MEFNIPPVPVAVTVAIPPAPPAGPSVVVKGLPAARKSACENFEPGKELTRVCASANEDGGRSSGDGLGCDSGTSSTSGSTDVGTKGENCRLSI